LHCAKFHFIEGVKVLCYSFNYYEIGGKFKRLMLHMWSYKH